MPRFLNLSTREIMVISLEGGEDLLAHLLTCLHCTDADHLCYLGFRLAGRVCPGCQNAGYLPPSHVQMMDMPLRRCTTCGGPPEEPHEQD